MRPYAIRWEVPGAIPCRVFGNFQVTYSFCPHTAALGSTQLLTDVNTKDLPWG